MMEPPASARPPTPTRAASLSMEDVRAHHRASRANLRAAAAAARGFSSRQQQHERRPMAERAPVRTASEGCDLNANLGADADAAPQHPPQVLRHLSQQEDELQRSIQQLLDAAALLQRQLEQQGQQRKLKEEEEAAVAAALATAAAATRMASSNASWPHTSRSSSISPEEGTGSPAVLFLPTVFPRGLSRAPGSGTLLRSLSRDDSDVEYRWGGKVWGDESPVGPIEAAEAELTRRRSAPKCAAVSLLVCSNQPQEQQQQQLMQRQRQVMGQQQKQQQQQQKQQQQQRQQQQPPPQQEHRRRVSLDSGLASIKPPKAATATDLPLQLPRPWQQQQQQQQQQQRWAIKRTGSVDPSVVGVLRGCTPDNTSAQVERAPAATPRLRSVEEYAQRKGAQRRPATHSDSSIPRKPPADSPPVSPPDKDKDKQQQRHQQLQQEQEEPANPRAEGVCHPFPQASPRLRLIHDPSATQSAVGSPRHSLVMRSPRNAAFSPFSTSPPVPVPVSSPLCTPALAAPRSAAAGATAAASAPMPSARPWPLAVAVAVPDSPRAASSGSPRAMLGSPRGYQGSPRAWAGSPRSVAKAKSPRAPHTHTPCPASPRASIASPRTNAVGHKSMAGSQSQSQGQIHSPRSQFVGGLVVRSPRCPPSSLGSTALDRAAPAASSAWPVPSTGAGSSSSTSSSRIPAPSSLWGFVDNVDASVAAVEDDSSISSSCPSVVLQTPPKGLGLKVRMQGRPVGPSAAAAAAARRQGWANLEAEIADDVKTEPLRVKSPVRRGAAAWSSARRPAEAAAAAAQGGGGGGGGEGGGAGPGPGPLPPSKLCECTHRGSDNAPEATAAMAPAHSCVRLHVPAQAVEIRSPDNSASKADSESERPCAEEPSVGSPRVPDQTRSTPAQPATSMSASSWLPFRSRGREGGHGVVCTEMRNVSSAYALKEELGSGRYGVTRVAECLETGQRYACKTVSKAVLKTRSDVEDIRREHTILQAMRGHPQVPTLEATFEDERAVHFVMELCGGGELFERIQQRKRYGEREAALVLRSVLQLVQHCHRRGIVHRDIKPENILLTSACSDTDVKLIDFGVAALLSSPDQVLREPVGSSFYIAPEVLDGEYSFPADVWSAGIVLYVLLLGGPPFWAPTDDGIVAAIRGDKLRFSRRVPLSDAAKDLVQRMLTRDPRRRITPAEALGHPWIVNMCQPSSMREVQSEKHGSPSIDRSASVA